MISVWDRATRKRSFLGVAVVDNHHGDSRFELPSVTAHLRLPDRWALAANGALTLYDTASISRLPT